MSLNNTFFVVIRRNILAAAFYASLGFLGIRFSMPGTTISPIWPAAGMGLALAILWGKRICPGLFVGSFLTTFVSLQNTEFSLPFRTALSCWIGFSAPIEAFIGAVLFHRYVGYWYGLESVRDVFRFSLIAVFATALTSFIGACGHQWFHLSTNASLVDVWLSWWFGDLAGVLILTSMILSWSIYVKWPIKKFLEAICFYVVVICVTGLVFGFIWPDNETFQQAHWMLPILWWAVFRFGQREVVLEMLIISLIVTLAAMYGHGPLIAKSLNATLIMTQSFICLLTLTMMSLTAALLERKHSESQLREANSTLEKRVEERMQEVENTASQLRKTNEELEKFNQAATGREMRIIELKKKINALSMRLNESVPYNLSFLDEENE